MANRHKELERAIHDITEVATGFGLDFFPMRYEICPAEIIYTFGAYGMPTRFSHWSFGKHFHKMKLHYDLGLSKIYELVINSVPCYAFLLNTNTLIQNKMIVAHVLAHSDFFKSNTRFMHTNRKMMDTMSQAAERIYAYESKYGKDKVEQFLDAVLALQEHIDPSLIKPEEQIIETPISKNNQYEDLWSLDEKEEMKEEPTASLNEKDILFFICENGRHLEEWEKDIISIVREEMLYFWPQLETKIMNEGWATYWHIRIMRELELTEKETIEFAKLNADITRPSETGINPYYVGLRLFESIERRYNEPTEEMKKIGVQPMSGRQKLFEVRELESDLSFLRNYVTKEFIQDENLYTFQHKHDVYEITDDSWEYIRDTFVQSRVNGGFPYITIIDGDYGRNGELYLKHHYEGTELDFHYLEKVLPYLYRLWGRPVHLETVTTQRTILFTYDGKTVYRKYV